MVVLGLPLLISRLPAGIVWVRHLVGALVLVRPLAGPFRRRTPAMIPLTNLFLGLLLPASTLLICHR
jgi:hypothetical protein